MKFRSGVGRFSGSFSFAKFLLFAVITLGLAGLCACSSGPDIEITKKDKDNVKTALAVVFLASGTPADPDCLLDKMEDALGSDGFKCLIWGANMEIANRYTAQQRKEIEEFCKKLDTDSMDLKKLEAAKQCVK